MSSFAWFDISTPPKSPGFPDAVENDVLIRCENSTQRFLFGVTGQQSALTVHTDGNAFLRNHLHVPVISVETIEGNVTLAKDVKMTDGTITAISMTASNMQCSGNMTVKDGGWIDAGDFIRASDYAEFPTLFVDVVSKCTSATSAIAFSDNVWMKSNLTVSYLDSGNANVQSNLTVRGDAEVTQNLRSSNLEAGASIKTPTIYTTNVRSLDNNQDLIRLMGLTFQGSNLTSVSGTVLFSNANLSFITSSNITASNVSSTAMSTSRISTLIGTEPVNIESVNLKDGRVECMDVNVENALIVNGITTLTSNVSIIAGGLTTSGTIETDADVYAEGMITCNTFVAGTSATTPIITTSSINAIDGGNLNIADSGVLIKDGCNLYTTNANFYNTKSSNINAIDASIVSVKVLGDLSVGNDVSASNMLTVPHIKANSIQPCDPVVSSTRLHEVIVERSNVTVGGLGSFSNILVSGSATFDNASHIVARCAMKISGKLTSYDEIKCYRNVEVPEVRVTSLASPNQELHLDSVSIIGKSNIFAYNMDTKMLNVQNDATIGRGTVATAFEVFGDLTCRSVFYADNVKGFTIPGTTFIEGIHVFDGDKMSLNTVLTSNLNVVNGQMVLGPNASVVNGNDGAVIIDTNGKIPASNVIATGSISSANLNDESVTTNKIATGAVRSSHLSASLEFKGTCRFENLDLSGTFSTSDNVMSVCGITFSNTCMGVGGVNAPVTPLHVKGKALMKDDDDQVTAFIGVSSSNQGTMALMSEDQQYRPGVCLFYRNLYSAFWNMATHPSSYDMITVEPGDLIMQCKKTNGSFSKIFLNNAVVCSSSNVGIWKQNPLAPFHTSIMAADKIGLGGNTSPTETVDCIGNLKIVRDANNPSIFIKMLDTNNAGVNIDLNPLENTKRLSVYNALGDITMSASDSDPTTCEHLRIQSQTGYIGFGTSNPVCPVHVNNVLRPGALGRKPPQTILVSAEEPSVVFQNDNGMNTSYTMRLSSTGQLGFRHVTSAAYCKLVGSNRTFNSSDNTVIPGAGDNTMELGRFTRVVLFTGQSQTGNYEVITNNTNQVIIVPLSGPTRRYNWTLLLNSLSVASTNTITTHVTSDLHYIDAINTTAGGSNILYVNSALKLLGIGTSLPSAALDIHSALSSNVFAIRGTCVLDTNFNLSNINKLSLRGPFFVNGRRILDDANNLVGINDIVNINSIQGVGSITGAGTVNAQTLSFTNELWKDDRLIIDREYNLSNIATIDARGPIYLSGKVFYDNTSNVSNISSLSILGPLCVNQSTCIDSNLDVFGRNLCARDKIRAQNGFILGPSTSSVSFSVGMQNESVCLASTHGNTIAITKHQAPSYRVAEFDIDTKDTRLFGSFFMGDKKVFSEQTCDLSNVSAFSLLGPVVVNGYEVISRDDRNLSVGQVQMRGTLTHNGTVLLDNTASLSNIGALSVEGPFSLGGKTILQGAAMSNIDTLYVSDTVTVATKARIGSMTVETPGDGNVGVMSCHSGFKVEVMGGRTILNCVGQNNAIYCDADISANAIKTPIVDSTDSMQDMVIKTQIASCVKVEGAGVISKSYFFSQKNNGYSIKSSERADKIVISDPNNLTLCDISSSDTHFKNKVLINNPTETDYQLAVGGTIYADQDIFCFSDARRKTNVRNIDRALERLRRLRGVFFNRTDDANRKEYTGVIAQEVERVLPQAVARDRGGYLSVAYGNMAGLLIEAIKELDARVVRASRVASVRLARGRYVGKAAFKNSKLLKAKNAQ